MIQAATVYACSHVYPRMHFDTPVSYSQTGRCFRPPPTHPVLSLCGKGSGWRGGTEADSGASGWHTQLMGRAKGWQRGRLSFAPPPPICPPLQLALCSPLLFCTIHRHRHPSGWWPIALLPNKNSPSHYSSASPGATRSLASLPGLRIWLCRHHLALPLPFSPLTPLIIGQALFL